MELQLMIFLAFTMVTVVTNTLLIWYAYKAFANFTLKTTETVTEFERSGVTKAWVESLQVAATQAVRITEATKQRMERLEPVIENSHKRYAATLARIDSRLQDAGEDISEGSRRVRDAVATPAFKFMAIAATVERALSDWAAEEDED